MSKPNSDTMLVIEALRARAAQRQRAGGLLSEQLAAERAGGADVRSRALRVVDELAAATSLGRIAAELDAGTITLGVGSTAVTLAPDDLARRRRDAAAAALRETEAANGEALDLGLGTGAAPGGDDDDAVPGRAPREVIRTADGMQFEVIGTGTDADDDDDDAGNQAALAAALRQEGTTP